MDDKPLLSSLLFSSKPSRKYTDEEKQNSIHLDNYDLHRNNSAKKAWKLSLNKNNLQNLLSEQEQVFSFKQILKRFEKHTEKNKYNKRYFSLLTELLSKKISNKDYLKKRSALINKEKSKNIKFRESLNPDLYINFLTNPGNHNENKEFGSTKLSDFLFDYNNEIMKTSKRNSKIVFPLTERKKKKKLLYNGDNYNEGNTSLLKDYDPVEDFILSRNKKRYIEHLENKYKYFNMPSNNKLNRDRFLKYQKTPDISEKFPIELNNKKPESMILKRIKREKQKAKFPDNLVFYKTENNFRKKAAKRKIRTNIDENNHKLLKEIYLKIKNNYCKL